LKKNKICVITGSRAEYGQLYYILKELLDQNYFELQLVVTGMHLSQEFGYTCKQIEDDGFAISRKVETLMSSDSPSGISKSMGLSMISFTDVFESLQPSLCLVLGDRYEIFAAVSCAHVFGIPIAHIAGGEVTDGVIDDGFRHSISKMSCLHFTSNIAYSNRLIKMGEDKSNVFTTGMPGLDSVYKVDLLNRLDFEKLINFKLGLKNFLITYHPLSINNNNEKHNFEQILSALKCFDDANFIFTYPNSDTYGRIIIRMINDFVTQNPNKSIAFKSMGQLRYLSSLKHVDVVVGNSSSGITEAPCFDIPTVNIGKRQNGRLKANSIIDCGVDSNDIKAAITQALKSRHKNVVNPYGGAGASDKIVEIIKKIDYPKIRTKTFVD
jgi:GDP/UDP-N,N'-diacetylbacillosamine 2-epimerase (hydrolysing)